MSSRDTLHDIYAGLRVPRRLHRPTVFLPDYVIDHRPLFGTIWQVVQDIGVQFRFDPAPEPRAKRRPIQFRGSRPDMPSDWEPYERIPWEGMGQLIRTLIAERLSGTDNMPVRLTAAELHDFIMELCQRAQSKDFEMDVTAPLDQAIETNGKVVDLPVPLRQINFGRS